MGARFVAATAGETSTASPISAETNPFAALCLLANFDAEPICGCDSMYVATSAAASRAFTMMLGEGGNTGIQRCLLGLQYASFELTAGTYSFGAAALFAGTVGASFTNTVRPS